MRIPLVENERDRAVFGAALLGGTAGFRLRAARREAGAEGRILLLAARDAPKVPDAVLGRVHVRRPRREPDAWVLKTVPSG